MHVSKCKKCGHSIDKGEVKCNGCGELYFENALPEDAVTTPTSSSSTPSVPDEPSVTPDPPKPEPVAEKKTEPTAPQPAQPETRAAPPEPTPANAGQFGVSLADISRSQVDIEMLKRDAQRLGEDLKSLKRQKEDLSYEVVDEVKRGMRPRLFFLTVLSLWTVVLTGACAFLTYKIYTGTASFISESVEEKFEDKHTLELMELAAIARTKEILDEHVLPQTQLIDERIADLDGYIDAAKLKFENKYNELAKEVIVMDARRNLALLTDHALSGSRIAYDEIEMYVKRESIPEIWELAKESLHRVQAFYETSNRIGQVDVSYQDSSGRGRVNEFIATDNLIEIMQTSPHWMIRAKSARLLAERNEPRVADALLKAALEDPILDVVKESLISFQEVTGYFTSTIFEAEEAAEWWAKHHPITKTQGVVDTAAPQSGDIFVESVSLNGMNSRNIN